MFFDSQVKLSSSRHCRCGYVGNSESCPSGCGALGVTRRRVVFPKSYPQYPPPQHIHNRKQGVCAAELESTRKVGFGAEFFFVVAMTALCRVCIPTLGGMLLTRTVSISRRVRRHSSRPCSLSGGRTLNAQGFRAMPWHSGSALSKKTKLV